MAKYGGFQKGGHPEGVYCLSSTHDQDKPNNEGLENTEYSLAQMTGRTCASDHCLHESCGRNGSYGSCFSTARLDSAASVLQGFNQRDESNKDTWPFSRALQSCSA